MHTSHIPDEAAAAALRDALPKVAAKLKLGMIGSLGTRRDSNSIGARALYRQLNTSNQPNHIRVAAMKGMLAATTQ